MRSSLGIVASSRVRAGAGAEVPTTGLRSHYEARLETGYTNGDALATIEDQTSGAHDLTQGTPSLQPTWRSADGPNAQPCFRFDGTDDFIAQQFTAVEPHTLVVVVSSAAESSTRRWPFVTHATTSNILALTEGVTASEFGTFVRTTGTGGGTSEQTTSSVDTRDWCVLEVTWTGTDAEFYRNGTLVNSVARGGAGIPCSTVAMGRQLSVAGQAFAGDIAFAGVWTTAFGSTARAEMSAYTQAHYGIG